MVHNRTGLHSQLLGMEGSGQSCNVSRPGVMAEAFHHSSQLCPVEAVPIPCRQTPSMEEIVNKASSTA